MLSLRDVMKAQPKRGRVASRDGRRGGGNRQQRTKPPLSSKKIKGIAIRPGASIAAASRSQSRQIYELDDDDDDDDSSCSSVEVRYQNPKQPYKTSAQTKLRRKRDSDEDDESSKESDEEDEIPYKMNFSQPLKGSHNNDDDGDSSDSDSDANGYESPRSDDEQPSTAAAEPLRPGDMIEYENTMIFVAGSGMGRHKAKVLGTNPKSKFPLKLSTGDHLEGDVRVCRTHEWIQGKLYKHAGYWKPIRSFRMRKRTLRNPDGTPQEATGGAVGVARTWKNQRDGLHQKAVEFLRGDHDDRLGNIGQTPGNHSGTKAAVKNNSSNLKAKKDDDDASSSDSSDASELMRLEFERLKKERNQKLQQEREKNQRIKSSLPQSSIRKSPPLLLSEDSDSDDNESNMIRRTTPLSSSKSSGLVLKKIPRTSISSVPEKDSDDDSLETQEELRRVKATSRLRKKTIQNNKPKQQIEISIDIDSKCKRQTPENNRRSNHNSPPSCSSSSAAKQVGRKSLTPKKRSFAMTTVASKVEDAKRSEEWLNEDSDSSSDGDDSLLGKPIFASKKSPANQSTMKRPPTSATRNKESSSSREPRAHSPMEENPIDLFEDSSGDDDSSGASACRKRNRRGERMLRSPNFDLQYRKSRHGKENQDSPLLFTQEGSKGVTKEELSASPRRVVKRSVVVGYRPLSISVDGTQREPDEDDQDDSPPSLAKAYRKFDAKKQRERDEEHRRTALKHKDNRDDSCNRKRSKQKHQKKMERKDSNKHYLQREKKRLQEEGARPPPYPRPRSEYHSADMSTQENEWTDCELLEDAESTCHRVNIRRKHVRKRAKPAVATAKKTSPSFFLDSELSPPKRRKSSSKKQKPTNSWNSSIDDSEEEDEPQHRRKKLTPKSSKSRNRNRNRAKHQRYELSPSSSSEGDAPNLPSSPWSTDCEVNSPPPSAIAVVHRGAHRNPTATPKGSAQSSRSSNHSHRKRKSSNQRRTNSKPSVFEFLSQDTNENPSALEGCVTKRNLSPKLLNSSKRKTSKPLNSSKRKTSKPKSARKRRIN